jgi:outer membrane protein OmpA-like peptidoglycan-associated protein
MLSWIAVQNEADRIEQDLERRSRRALDEAGHDWASIAFSGRDGLLVGTARRAHDRADALAIAGAVWGVRTVEDRVRLAVDPVIAVPVAPQATKAVPRAREAAAPRATQAASHERTRDLPPAVPLQARSLAAGDAGARALAEAAPAIVAAEVPAKVAPHRPQFVPVMAREIAEAPALPSDMVAVAAAPEREPEPERAVVPAGPPERAETPERTDVTALSLKAPEPPPVPVRRPRTTVARDHANVPLPARKLALGPLAPIANVPLPLRKAAAWPAPAAALSPAPLVTAAVGEDGARPEAECRAAVLSIGMSGAIRFARNKSSLNGEGRAQLDRLAQVARVCPRLSLSIAGHADARGPARRNLKLSQRRAAVAVSYLINKGIDAGRLQAVGYGESRPLAPNDTAENRAKNRRVEVETQDPDRDLSASPAGARQGAGNGLPDR